MTLTKGVLAERLHAELGLNKREAKELVAMFFDDMREALEAGQPVQLSGFGTFELRDKRKRPGRNPETGEAIPIAARRSVTFRSGQVKAHTADGDRVAAARLPRKGRVVTVATEERERSGSVGGSAGGARQRRVT